MVKLMVIMLLASAIFITGCSLTESMETKNRRLAIITNLNLRMIVDDFEAYWLYEKVSPLSEYHPRVGK